MSMHVRLKHLQLDIKTYCLTFLQFCVSVLLLIAADVKSEIYILRCDYIKSVNAIYIYGKSKFFPFRGTNFPQPLSCMESNNEVTKIVSPVPL